MGANQLHFMYHQYTLITILCPPALFFLVSQTDSASLHHTLLFLLLAHTLHPFRHCVWKRNPALCVCLLFSFLLLLFSLRSAQLLTIAPPLSLLFVYGHSRKSLSSSSTRLDAHCIHMTALPKVWHTLFLCPPPPESPSLVYLFISRGQYSLFHS